MVITITPIILCVFAHMSTIYIAKQPNGRSQLPQRHEEKHQNHHQSFPYSPSCRVTAEMRNESWKLDYAARISKQRACGDNNGDSNKNSRFASLHKPLFPQKNRSEKNHWHCCTKTTMNTIPFFPDLLEQYMVDCKSSEQWVTVQEFRTHFDLDPSCSHAIAGFLRRLQTNPFRSCRFRVTRIESKTIYDPAKRVILRYLVQERNGKKT